MATVTIKGKAYTNVTALKVDVMYQKQCTLAVDMIIDGHIQRINVAVPTWFRVEVKGNVGVLRCNRAEISGNVNEVATWYAKCTGKVGKLKCDERAYKESEFNSKAGIKVLSEIAKDFGKDLGRAVVLHVDGNINELYVNGDNMWGIEYATNDCVVNGNVALLESSGSIGVTGDIVDLSVVSGASLRSKPKECENVSDYYEIIKKHMVLEDNLEDYIRTFYQNGFEISKMGKKW